MYKKKAFLLIEILVYVSISIVLITVSFTMMFNLVNLYKKALEESKIITFENNCYLNINRLLKRNKIKSINISDNKLNINCINEDNTEEIDVIEKVNNKIFIRYYPKQGKGGSNVLLNNITEFNVIRKKNVIYLTIIKGGISYKWCI